MGQQGFVAASVLSLFLVLPGCGDNAVAPEREAVDPAVAAALGDQILVDPDLSRQNEGNAALTGGIDHALPLPDKSDAAIDAARAEATAILGGREALLTLPEASSAGPATPLVARLSIVSRARFSGAPEACVETLRHDFEWAARMPRAFPIYPYGAVQDAVGGTGERCRLRAVNFRTPVPAADVLAFYHSQARAGGYSSALSVAGDEQVLRGERGDSGFTVYASEGESGSTSIDLVTVGG